MTADKVCQLLTHMGSVKQKVIVEGFIEVECGQKNAAELRLLR
jgi:hypothetical protein